MSPGFSKRRHTVRMGEGSIDGQPDAAPHLHVTRVAVKLHRLTGLIQLPVHLTRDDVRPPVVAPHERGVDAVDVRRQPEVRYWSALFWE